MNNSPIGIFDSGVGGLTVLSEIEKLLPEENFIYLADQAFAPYGKRTISELQERTKRVSKFLIEKNVKLIVVACNTASTSSIKYLRKNFPVPFIGVVPVIKTLASVSETKKTAVLATPITTKSIYLDLLISEFGQDITVYKVGDTGLEGIIEKGDLSDPKISIILKKHIDPLKKLGVDTIALGCTHYPFLRDALQKTAGENVKILDSGGAVARQVKRVLTEEKLLSPAKHGEDWYYTTGATLEFQDKVKKLTGKHIKVVYAKL
ncbi:MAG: glutamate racemase [Candidatus Levybacteria bacterium]|nr:glutamate racemase [Candidatus Levybacteria bacterium]